MNKQDLIAIFHDMLKKHFYEEEKRSYKTFKDQKKCSQEEIDQLLSIFIKIIEDKDKVTPEFILNLLEEIK